MSGELSQMSATELLQALELSQKSGTLTLALPEGSAQLHLKDGNLIRADYGNKGREVISKSRQLLAARISHKAALKNNSSGDTTRASRG